MQRILLLGVPIDPLSFEEAVTRLHSLLGSEGKHHVMTPNSEMLVAAKRNSAFREVLRSSALNLPDSAGLLLAARMTGQHLPERVTGVDTVMRLCAEIGSEHPVFFLGAAEGVGRRAAELLHNHNPNISVVGTYAGNPSDAEAGEIIARINASGAHLLLVAYGAPEQDLWIAKHLSSLRNVRVAIGVGGTFDFIAGAAHRAPLWMQTCGLEWLWRFILEPKRVFRIVTAVIVFPLLVLRFGKTTPQ